MNARQLAEVVQNIVKYSPNKIGEVTWDGLATYEGRFHYIPNYDNYRRYVCNREASLPVIEAVINDMLGDITDPSVGGTRQHTESVNNFALPVGQYVGFIVDGFDFDGECPALIMLIPVTQEDVR